MILLWFAIVLPVLLTFLGFAIDLGLIYLNRTQMQAVADSAALAAACEMPGLHRDRQASFSESMARGYAKKFAEANLPKARHGNVLQDADIEFGQWNSQERKFILDEWPYTAVRVTLKKTGANGNACPLYFLPIIEKSTQDLTVESVAVAAPRLGGTMSGGLIGTDWVDVSGNTETDGYDPTFGYYGGSNIIDSGVTSNGDVTVSGNAYIRGSARPGMGEGQANVQGSADVTGDTAERPNRIALNEIVFPVTPTSTNNDNNRIKGNNSDVKFTNSGDLTIGGKSDVTLPAGEYYLKSLTLGSQGKLVIESPQHNGNPTIIRVTGDFKQTAQSSIEIQGPVEFYIEGDIDITGQGIVNESRNVNDLKLLSTGDSIKLAGGSDFYGFVYAPTAALELYGNSDFYGGAAALNVTLRGNVDVHADRTVGFWDQNTPMTRLVW